MPEQTSTANRPKLKKKRVPKPRKKNDALLKGAVEDFFHMYCVFFTPMLMRSLTWAKVLNG